MTRRNSIHWLALLAFSTAFLFFVSVHRVEARYESCPVVIRIEPVGEGNAKRAAALFGFELAALGPRSVDATIAFDTDDGWYTTTVPPIVLHEEDRHYNGPSNEYVQPEWISPAMYVRFTKPVRLLHAWVSRATAVGDTFGWGGQGGVECSPYSNGDIADGLRGDEHVKLYNEDHLNAQPGRAASILDVQPSAPLGKTDCPHPFTEATTTHEIIPNYPSLLGAEGVGADAGVAVALRADGTLADAWIWVPSGHKEFDDAALAAAKKSSYKAGTAYCKPVPGTYLFWTTFGGDT